MIFFVRMGEGVDKENGRGMPDSFLVLSVKKISI